MLLSFAAPPGNDRGPRFMEKAFAAIHQATPDRQSMTLIFAERDGRAGLFIRAANGPGVLIRDYIAGKYPEAMVERIDDEAARPSATFEESWWIEATLTPELFPILRHSQFEDALTRQYEDPIDSLLQSVQSDSQSAARIEIHVAPATPRRCRAAKRAVRILDRPFFHDHPRIAEFYAAHITQPWSWWLAWPFSLSVRDGASLRSQTEVSSSRQHDRESDLQAAFDKLGGHLFEARIRLIAYAERTNEHSARTRLRVMAGALGSFTRSRLAVFRISRIRRGTPPPARLRGLLSHEELATLFHPPTATVQGPRFQTAPNLELEAPREAFAAEQPLVLGLAKAAGGWRTFGLDADTRRRHLYVVGKTGMGKTSLLLQMINQDIAAGRGVAVLDPHGDLTEAVLESVPPNRTNDVILLDPGDPTHAVAYNPLACHDPLRRDLVADDVVSALDKIYDFSSMPRAADMLRNALFVLIEHDQTLLELLRFLADEDTRRRLLQNVEDEVVRLYWEREFPGLDKSARGLTMAAILNKIRPFLLSPRMRAIVGQANGSLHLRSVLDERKVLLVNLSKGRLGEGNANLLGTLLVTGIQQAALSRADVSEEERTDFHVYIDEFQNVTTPSIATVLSEGRKFRLNLTCAHQFLDQLNPAIQSAVFGNVGSMIAFQVGPADAAILAEQLAKHAGQIQPQHLANLPRYAAYARVLLDGAPSLPFSMRTMTPQQIPLDRREIVREASRRRYAQPMATIQRQWKREFSRI
ncbi:MAG: type IV secretion system DNA-binding domain-containing protein [Planctomycetes bacterium]|nr:type IV secretion system DNA-binding domain-containing protein [Planctomycetota bacterium]